MVRRDAYNPLGSDECMAKDGLLNSSAELWLIAIRSMLSRGTPMGSMLSAPCFDWRSVRLSM